MKMVEPTNQSVAAKIAESRRPYFGQSILTDPIKQERFRGRAEATLLDLNMLNKNKEIQFSPFLEIGAGCGQRSAALLNKYNAQGVATDICLNSLLDIQNILQLLNYQKSPVMICCDAHHLPFLANSFQFIFAYQTFHHFANPIPVFAECYRVLAKQGYLYFNEEPLDSSFRQLLRGKRMLSHPPTRIQRLAYKIGVEKVFWDDGVLERSLGMTEARFDIDIWRKSLEPYAIIDIEVNRKLRMHSNLRIPRINSILSSVIGGNVKGICKKMNGEEVTGELYERLICLDCNSNIKRIRDEEIITCDTCNRRYPIIDGILRMLPKELEAELFPDNY